jgi:hypothetical protein
VNGVDTSSPPEPISVPVALMSVNEPGWLLTRTYWALALTERANPAAADTAT